WRLFCDRDPGVLDQITGGVRVLDEMRCQARGPGVVTNQAFDGERCCSHVSLMVAAEEGTVGRYFVLADNSLFCPFRNSSSSSSRQGYPRRAAPRSGGGPEGVPRDNAIIRRTALWRTPACRAPARSTPRIRDFRSAVPALQPVGSTDQPVWSSA